MGNALLLLAACAEDPMGTPSGLDADMMAFTPGPPVVGEDPPELPESWWHELRTLTGELNRAEALADGTTCTCRMRVDAVEDWASPWWGESIRDNGGLYRASWTELGAPGCCSELPGEGGIGVAPGVVAYSSDGAPYGLESDLRATNAGRARLDVTGTYSGRLVRGSTHARPFGALTIEGPSPCGWGADAGPPTQPEPYSWPFTLPRAPFYDACGGLVRLDTLTDGYLVVAYMVGTDTWGRDAWSRQRDALTDDLAAVGVVGELVTMLTLSGADPVGQAADWADTYGITGPVLVDRGLGTWRASEFISFEGTDFPHAEVYAPDGALLFRGKQGLDGLLSVIRDHAGVP